MAGKAKGAAAERPSGDGAAFEFRHVRTACPGGISDHRAHKLELIDGPDEIELFAFEVYTHAEIVEALNDIWSGLWTMSKLRLIEASNGPDHNGDEKTLDAASDAIDRLIDNLQQRANQGRRFADIDSALDAPEDEQPGHAARKAVA